MVRVYVCGPIKLDRETRLVTVNEQPVHLPRQDFSVLFRLMQDKGKVVSHEELCRFAGIQDDPTHGNLRSIIKGLRRALRSNTGKLISTEWAMGYRIAP